MHIALIDRGHGKSIDGFYVDSPNKMSPKPPPVGVFEGDLNSWIVQEIGSEMLAMDMFFHDLNSHGFYNCPTITRRNSINRLVKSQRNRDNNYYCLSIHNNAKSKKWQTEIADTRVLYNPFDSDGKALAQSICNELIAMGRKAFIKPRPGLALLKLACPEVLIECSWMDNKEDIKWIKKHIFHFCHAIAKGCKNWTMNTN